MIIFALVNLKIPLASFVYLHTIIKIQQEKIKDMYRVSEKKRNPRVSYVAPIETKYLLQLIKSPPFIK